MVLLQKVALWHYGIHFNYEMPSSTAALAWAVYCIKALSKALQWFCDVAEEYHEDCRDNGDSDDEECDDGLIRSACSRMIETDRSDMAGLQG